MKKKIIALSLAVAMFAIAALGSSFAYLTDDASVQNTFTVGKVDITLDEAPVNEYGEVPTGTDSRVFANTYKLIPGHTYTKDPTVTVLADSEDCYVRTVVTISNYAELKAIYGDDFSINDLTTINADWTLVSTTPDATANTITYVYNYKEVVILSDTDTELAPLFETFTIIDDVESEALATINNMTIDVVANAIQADGFTDAAGAWAAFSN